MEKKYTSGALYIVYPDFVYLSLCYAGGGVNQFSLLKHHLQTGPKSQRAGQNGK